MNNLTNGGTDMSGVIKLAEALRENQTLRELKCAASHHEPPARKCQLMPDL